MPEHFRALLVEQDSAGNFTRKITTRRLDELPAGELVLRVHYSSVNYKDALSALGRPGVTKRYPHTPGIDAAGEVVSCSDGSFAPGDAVIVTGHDLGMNIPGGYGEYVRVPASWAVRLPQSLTLKESMILGTAGLTAGLSLYRLEQAGVTPETGEILVTGATGGVGSLAVELLARAGYHVVAATGKLDEEPYLRGLGARQVIGRDELLAGAERPLLKERWSGTIDVVGGSLLAAAIKSTRYGGTVTCCGLAGSPDLPINVFPFILRGVTLAGIDSAEAPAPARAEVWQRLATRWRPERSLASAELCPMEALEEVFPALLSGKHRGRTVVSLLP
ncbi:YhdH/YhfP family quinone oxidoreductase [Geomonas sp. Red875]|uniref:YhdH/YhfP family quinone oxidoreductase n=2 Tax=Geomesophilobacter sediminis TaxID=2798584 RepID=A0A8J7IRP4_9BACT|nr:YhdH/YhfP family quinone oxidoreductase [Geomesophilobacter sediminis]